MCASENQNAIKAQHSSAMNMLLHYITILSKKDNKDKQ